ncbi:MAG: hypothetical protein H0U03_01060 [Actinobacteria bacterium]|nr:hypothetical protein [Actinomycetota bacterium]
MLSLLGSAFLAASLGAGAQAPATLLTTKAPIRAFAQDGGRIAWASQCKVRIRSLAAKRTFVVGGTGLRSACFEDDSWRLALGGSRALWGGYYRTQSNNRYGAVLTGSIGASSRKLWSLEQVERSWGGFLTSIVGDGSTLAYANVYVRQMSGPDCPPCFYRVTGQPVRRVSSGQAVVPGARPAVAIAADTGRVAVVPADSRDTTSRIRPVAVPDGPVEVRDAVTGSLVTSFAPRGMVTAVALSGGVAAVIVRDQIAPRIERYSVTTGALIETLPLFQLAADELGLSGTMVVFRIGREIYVFDTASRKQVRVTATATPIGLSIEGNRVAWAENIRIGRKLRGRIRNFTLTP